MSRPRFYETVGFFLAAIALAGWSVVLGIALATYSTIQVLP